MDKLKQVKKWIKTELTEDLIDSDSDASSTISETDTVQSEEIEKYICIKNIPSDINNCKHYKSNCKIYAECCEKVYKCVKCHDNEEDHKATNMQYVCKVCGCDNNSTNICDMCDTVFGEYYCEKCSVFNNNDDIVHCPKCNICVDINFVSHCDICGYCIWNDITNQHKHVSDLSSSLCYICKKSFQCVTDPVYILDCGNIAHIECYRLM